MRNLRIELCSKPRLSPARNTLSGRSVYPAPLFSVCESLSTLAQIKGKVEWIDPNPVLVHYVESGQLIVPWKEHKGFLRDEERAERLREHNEHQGFQRDSPIVRALVPMFDEVGEPVMFLRGTLSGEPEGRT